MELAELQRAGVTLHAITSEPGGDDEVKARLAYRKTNLRFPIHSDPEYKLLLREPGGEAPIYVKTPYHLGPKFGPSMGDVPYCDYTVVQPALVVMTDQGKVHQVWSWRCKPLSEILPEPTAEWAQYENIKEQNGQLVRLKPWSNPPAHDPQELGAMLTGAWPLVGVRPVSADLLPSILKRRPIQVQGKKMKVLMSEFVGPSVGFALSMILPLIGLASYSIARVVLTLF